VTLGDEICLEPATHLAARISRREISSRELLEMFLARVERLNPVLNAVVTLDADRALAEADRADRAIVAGGPTGPLHGLPITVKDAIEVAGLRSTGGSAALRDHVPAADAPSVGRLRRAGAVVFGKTNVPEWSGDIQTYNTMFGTTNNPWDPARTPGGSSGGAAAAVASGLTSFEIGTDIGGSVRIPSGWCGVCGHKPSYGVVSQRGYLDSVGGGTIDADINVFGPIARSVGDLEMLLDVLAAPDADKEVAWSLTLPDRRHQSLADYRVGLWLDDPACEVDSEAVDLLTSAAAGLAASGARVEPAHPPFDIKEVEALFTSLLLPAISLSVPRDLADAISGTYRNWLDLHRQRTALRRVWADWFRDYDVLLCPVMPMPAFPHDQHATIAERFVTINGTERSQAGTLAWTGLIGVAYLPSTVVPVGRTATGLPVGVQVVGPYLEDRTPLFAARRLAEVSGGYEPPPLARR
jgi:amidase